LSFSVYFWVTMREFDSKDTISAIATAPGAASVSIVRVSGSRALAIADQVFRCVGQKPSERAGGTFVHGHVLRDGAVIDEALLLIMRAPHSYTREDVIEIQGHGGSVVAKQVLRTVLEAGARMAEPGEFTRRAFLNGRLDLLQAEAVLDLIQSRSERAAAAAQEQLAGRLSADFDQVYAALMGVAADIEATLDFPEDELPAAVASELLARLGVARSRVESLLARWDEGHLLRDGATVVISGRPNVGKSTLLNTLLGTERAIVSEIPGTTRDVIEEGLVLDGIPIRLIDTAGLRETDCAIEREGIRRAHAHRGRADLQLYVVDASQDLTEEDRAHMAALDPARSIVVINKTDLSSSRAELSFVVPSLKTSLKTGMGVDALKQAIAEKLGGGHKGAIQHAVISERHRQLLRGAGDSVDRALSLLKSGHDDAPTLAAEHLREALENLGQATGKVYHDELLNSIFSRFCIGK
jgi:tRNA modification GTPase